MFAFIGPHYVPGPVNIRAFIDGDMGAFYRKFATLSGHSRGEPHAAIFSELADRSDPWNLAPFMAQRAGCLDSCRTSQYRASVISMWDQFRTKYLAPGEVDI